jgi:hypothetical protein
VQNGVTLRDTTDANGNYSISNVPDGNNASIYRIMLQNPQALLGGWIASD